ERAHGEHVRLQTGAIHHVSGTERPAARLHHDFGAVLTEAERLHRATDRGAALLQLDAKRRAHRREVDDPGVENVQRGDATCVGLELAEPFRPDALGAYTVRSGPADELVE